MSNRKGKRIVAFELKVTCKWEGSVDYDEVSGELVLPYVSEDVENSEYADTAPTCWHPLLTCACCLVVWQV